MGYESRFYIVEKGSCIRKEVDGKKYVWAEIVATFNMGKIYSVSDIVRNYKPTDCFICDEGTELVRDLYGDPLKEISINDLIRIIGSAIETDDGDYRRYKPLMGFLISINQSQWDNLVALHYGY